MSYGSRCATGTAARGGAGGRGRGQPGDSAAARGGGVRGAGAPRDPGNGISGDARPSTVALGKKIFDMKVDYAVKQIQGFLKGQ